MSGGCVPEEDPGLSMAWLLAVPVTGRGSRGPTHTPRMHTPLLLPSLPQICLGHAVPRCHPTPGSERVQGGHQSTREVGWVPAWFLFSWMQKPRATLVEIDEVMLVRT